MAKKSWCFLTSHPLVVQVAEKYNLNKDDARSILNDATKDNPALKSGNVSLKFLEEQQSFKDALDKYIQKFVDVENALFADAPGFSRKERLDFMRDLHDNLLIDCTEEEADRLMNRLPEIAKHVNKSKVSTTNLAGILKAFPDTRRLEFLGNWLCQYMSELVTRLETNPETRSMLGIAQKDRRIQYFADSNVTTALRRQIISDIEDAKDECLANGKKQLASELDALVKYYDTILFMYGTKLFRTEGVNIDIEGNVSTTGEDSSSNERNETGEDGQEEDNPEEQPTSSFSASDQNKSISSKIVPEIKLLLGNLRNVDSNGEDIDDPYGYGLWSYVPTSLATNKILNACQGCQTFSQMIEAMINNERSTPWLTQLIQMLDTESELDMFDETNVSTSRKEQLQSMFFKSFRKQFTWLRSSYSSHDADGNMIFVNTDANVNTAIEKLMSRVRRRFARHAGLGIFDKNLINFQVFKNISSLTINAKNTNSVFAKMQEASKVALALTNDSRMQGKNLSFAPAYNKLHEAELALKDILKGYYGIDITNEMLDSYLSNTKEENRPGNSYSDPEFELRYRRISKLMQMTQQLTNAFDEWGKAQAKGETTDNPYTNPFILRKDNSDYKDIWKIRQEYENIVNAVTEFSPDSLESRAHINGKDYYSWNNPSTVQTILEGLTLGGRKKIQDYIKRKYAADLTWFCKPGSTVDEPHFYADWLEDLFYGEAKDTIAYSEKPSFCGQEYEDQSDVSYAINVMNDFFSLNRKKKDVSWYRMLISSDKPRYSTIRAKRYSTIDENSDGSFGEKDYRSIIADRAVDFFGQELRRSANVVQYALKGKGITIDGYDLDKDDFAAIKAKMKKKERVTLSDVVSNGRYIFRGSGAAFYLNKFVIGEIENGTELGQYVVDRIFNPHLFSAKDDLVSKDIIPVFKRGFHKYMQDIKKDFSSHLEKIGAYTERVRNEEDGNKTYHMRYLLGPMLQWQETSDEEVKSFREIMYLNRDEAIAFAKSKNPEFDEKKDAERIPYYCERVQFDKMLYEYIYNNWLAKSNMSEIFDVDLAFYGDTTNFQKRNAQVISAGYCTDPEAKIHGQKVSDGKYRTITVKTTKEESKQLANISTALHKRADQITDERVKKQFLKGVDDTLGKLSRFDSTDGQAFSSLTGLRKKRAGQGDWSRSNSKELDMKGYYLDENNKPVYIYTDEAVYQRMKRGEARTEDFLHVFCPTSLKPFVYSFANMSRDGRGTITVPVQHKNSEYALVYMMAFIEHEAPTSQLAGISKFLEETAKDDIQTGIDTVNFDSGVKIGNNSGTIELNNLNGQETYEALKKAVYGETPNKDASGKKIYKQGVVTEYDNTDFKLVQEKPEHFKNSAQPMGTQMKILAINNIPADAKCTLPDGTEITGAELRSRYFSALSRKMRSVEGDFRHDLGLDLPREQRLHKLSYTLKNAMSTDQKFNVEMRRALSITERDGVEQFVLPLDDPGMQTAIEAMLYSKIRKVYYKQKTKGGIVVQATSWGADNGAISYNEFKKKQKNKNEERVREYYKKYLKDYNNKSLHIRFYSSNPADAERGGVVPTFEEFEVENDIFGAEAKKAYDKYLKDYQQGYAWFEAEIPMPNHVRKYLLNGKGEVDEKFINKDKSWNMEEIRKVVPESVFEAICYRTPTESKYSMMVCKIKRFAPENAGSVAKFPKELTEFTGSDFDIDTDTIEIRPDVNDKGSGVDNELFDLQMAALRSWSGLQEGFRSGDFSDLSQLSYRVTLIRSGKYTEEEINAMSPKQLKKACAQVEDLDLMNPVTDVLLHNQNSDAKAMIAIAAVGVTSHAFMSLYNDPDNINNTTRVVFKEASAEKVGENFTVVNDKPGESEVSMTISGPVTLDAQYDMDGNLISTAISKYVGASADAAKDAAEYRLNINKRTLPILITMHRLGVSSDVARMFIAHPIIREVTAKMNSGSSFGYMSLEAACDEVRKDIMHKENMSKEVFGGINDSVKHDGALELRYTDLMKSMSDPESEGVEDKLKMLHILEVLSKKSELIRNLDSFTRYNSGQAMRGSSFLDRFSMRQRLTKLQNNLNKEQPIIVLPDNISILDEYEDTNYGKLCSMFPYIAQTIYGEQDMTDGIILENMHTYNPAFFEAVKTVTRSTLDSAKDSSSTLKKLYIAWKNYLFFVGENRIADFTDKDTVEYYTIRYPYVHAELISEIQSKHPEIYKDVIDGNTYLDSFGDTSTKDGYLPFSIITTSRLGMSDTELEQYKRDWESLLKYPETRRIAIDSSIYFLARAAAFSRDTPVSYMPLAIKEAIPGYIETLENADRMTINDMDLTRFVVSFFLHNADDTTVTPHVYTGDIDEAYDDENNVLVIPKNRTRALADWLRVDEEKRLKLDVPVFVGDDIAFLVDTDAEIVKQELDGEEFYIIPCIPVQKKGIRNQMMEYTGLDLGTSIFAATEDNMNAVPAEDVNTNPPFLESSPIMDMNDDIVDGHKVGTYIESDAFTWIGPDSFEKLAKNRRDKSNSPYLETRTFLRRTEKIINLLGMKMSSATKISAYNGSFGYAINLAATKYGDQHQRAIQIAGLVDALSNLGERGDHIVKTYCTPDEANAVEISFPVDANRNLKGLRTVLDNNELAYTINESSGEVIIEIQKDDMDAGEQIKGARTALSVLREEGLTSATTMEVNYIQSTPIIHSEEIIKTIKDETGDKKQSNEEPSGTTGSNTRNQDWQQVRVSNLVDLAERKLAGEKAVDSEIREIFGETKHPMKSTEVSYVSDMLADSVVKDMDKGVYDEVLAITGELSGEKESRLKYLDDFIINTANWIIGNRPETAITTMMEKSGIAPQSAQSIIATIKRQLKELDIC